MNSENGKIGFSIELDNAQLNRDIKKSQQAFRDLGDQVESECSRMDDAFSGISRSVASIGAAWSLQELGKNVATIRGEFQSLQKTMEVMLQSKSKAEALMAQMVQTAATTPFGLQEVAGGAKQLLAYGLEAEKVNDTLIRLGNIASGLKIPLGDLIYLYGTTMAQGRLYTQDLNQFTGRGIPMIQQLADHFGVAESKVKGLVEEGKVGFPEVQAVINNLTNEGGKFFNLMAEQSTLINGKISNLEDAFDSMFNEIGQNNEGVINDTLDLTMLLVENYKVVGDVLMTLVADYGVYKATLMAVTAYTNACYNYEIAQLKTVVAEKGAEIDADLASAVSKGRMTAQRAAEVQALRLEVAAKIEAATVTERVAQAELLQAQMKYESFQVTVSLSKMRVAQAQQELAAAQASGDATAVETAKTNLNTAIKERNNVSRQSSILKRNLETATTNANAAAQAKATLVTKADTAAKKIQATTTSLLTLCTNGLTKAFKALKVALATNPFGIIMIAITTVIGALMTMNDTMSETSEEVERFGESAVKQSRSVETLLAVINNTSTTSKVHKDAVYELCKIYEDYGIKIDNERSKLDQLNQMREEAIRLIKLEGEERQKANLIASYEDAINEASKDMKTQLQTALSEAEWDGSGQFEDWDANEYQERAKELAIIISSIIQSEGEELAKLSGDAYEAKLKEINGKIQKAYKDLGLDIEKTFTRMAGDQAIDVTVGTDVGEIDILKQYMERVQGIIQHRQKLIDSINNSKSATEEEAEAVDYEKMSFDELFDAAYNAKEQIASVGTLQPKPLVNTSSIDNAITQTDALINNMLFLEGSPMLSGGKSFGFNYQVPFTTPNFSAQSYNNWLGFQYDPFNVPGNQFGFNLPSATSAATNTSQQEALNELDKRIVTAIKTRKGTSDLLKEVNTALETVEAGSADEKRLLAIQKRLQNQQKKFKSSSSSSGETPAQRRANIEKAEQETEKALQQSSQQRQEMERNLHFQEEQNRINLERDASKRKREQLKLDHEKELAQLEQQKQAAIKAEIQRQKAVFDAQENEKKAQNKNYVKRNFTDADIDQTQIATIVAQYQTLYDQTIALQKQGEADLLRSEFQSMQDYLKNYGTYQQQKLAIAQEYAEKIRNASSEGERLSLERERDSKLSSIETAELKNNMNWSAVFGEFGGMFGEMMRPVLEDAKKYIQTDEFKNSDQASQQALIEAIQQMEQSLGGADKVSFEKLGTEIKAYQTAMLKLRQAQNEYKSTYDALTTAQKNYEEAIATGTEDEQRAAAEALRIAQENETAASQNIQTLQTTATEAQNTMTQTATTLKTSMDGVVSGLQKLASGSVSGAYEGMIELGKNAEKIGGKLGEAFGKVADKLESVPIIGWIVSIIDIFKDGLSVVIGGILDAVFDAVSGIIGDILSGDLFKTIGESLLQGIGKIFDAITFGGFSSWFGGGESDKTLEEDIERLTATNEALQRTIENLTDVMEDSAVKDAADLYEQQKDLLNESEANTQEMMRRSGAAYSNGFLGIGGSHSSNKKINDAMSSSEWDRISSIVGRTIKSAGDFWTLSSEEMRKVATEAPDLYGKIKGYADDGHKDAAQYMDEYIEYAKQREELEEAYYEKLTNVSFDTLRDEFKNALTDMEMSATDFANNFNNLLVDAIAEALMTDKYDPMIKELYEKWAKFMEDGELTDDELAELQKDRDNIYNSMDKDRQFLETFSGGDSSSQDSTKKGFATASQDSVDELNGRFTAVQMDTSAIRELMLQYGVDMTSLRLSASEIRQHTDEIRNLSLTAIDHLETISKNTHELFEMNERLGKIEKNTRNL